MRQKKAPWYAKPTSITPVEHREDDRGSLTVIANAKSFKHPIGAVGVLISKKGTVRAEHSHRREGHDVYLVSGGMIYRERRESGMFEMQINPGEGVFTPPNRPHAFYFTEDSVCVVVANISRTQKAYERDLTRLAREEELFSVIPPLTVLSQKL